MDLRTIAEALVRCLHHWHRPSRHSTIPDITGTHVPSLPPFRPSGDQTIHRNPVRG